jgi:hypothetical protein
MKNLIRSTVLSLCFAIACMAYGAVPSLNVTVSDASGKVAFKGSTDKTGAFTTGKVKPGIYDVQFTSPGAIPGSYAIVVSAGVKKVSAAGIAGEKFAKGGVALKVNVQNLLNIVGQVSAESKNAVSTNGKKKVWIPPQAGSHMPGKWVEEGSAEWVAARTAGNMSSDDVSKIQSSSRAPGQ